MNCRYFTCSLLFVLFFLPACSNQQPSVSSSTGAISQMPNVDNICILNSEEDLKEQILQLKSKASFALDYYYRPTAKLRNMTLKQIKIDPYNLVYTYSDTSRNDGVEYNFVWFYSQPEGDAWLANSIDRLGYVYVYPDNPLEGFKYVSDMNRDEAKKAGRVSWDIDYSVNGLLLRANVPWEVGDEDVTKYLVMEKVPIG